MRLLLPLALFLSISLQAQRYSKVKVYLDETHSIDQLARLGLEVDHGEYRPNVHLVNAFSEWEIQQIHDSGFLMDTLISDLKADFLRRNQQDQSTNFRGQACNDESIAVYDTPINYNYGSMGGYHTYQEMLDILDDMAAKYPNIFKAKTPITSAYTTHEGREIFWVKISDNPNEDEDEPEVLYTALHHAREPNSLSQMIFYIWYLLENYETNEEVKYLVDNVEMYFIPCVNPDGYVYNETTNPQGGGFWRKNRRDNGDGTFGVDLNRNYPYKWGYDDDGSSPNPSSETYRGPAPASEPEVQMVMEFCNSHQFQLALNYHTWGNLFIYPWGYVDGPSPDDAIFKGFAKAMVNENNFLSGYGSETVGYIVNGDSDDWMYGEQTSKGKMLSMTPEVGPGFWPTQIQIDELNKTTTTMNLTMAALTLNYGLIKPQGDLIINQLNGSIDYSIQKLGLKLGLLSVSLAPVSNNILSVGSSDNFGLFNLEETTANINYNLDPAIQDGEEVRFKLVLDNGEFQWEIPIERIYSSTLQTIFIDPVDDFSQWGGFGSWDTTDEDFHSPSTSITDSPHAEYANNTANETEMAEPVQLQNAVAAYLTFWTKWDIEADYDYVQVLLSVDGSAPIPLCGKYTQPGVGPQPFDEPVYDGVQSSWVFEEIKLTQYIPLNGNGSFKVLFRLFSDGFVTGDGFYFDDLTITTVQETVSILSDFDPTDLRLSSRPNPAKDYVYLDLGGILANVPDFTLQVTNSLGQLVHVEKIRDLGVIKLDINNWPAGLYLYNLSDGARQTKTGKFVVSR